MEIWSNTSRVNWDELCSITWKFCLQILPFVVWFGPIVWALSHMQLSQPGSQWVRTVIGTAEGAQQGWVSGIQAWGMRVIIMVPSWSLWAVTGFIHLELSLSTDLIYLEWTKKI